MQPRRLGTVRAQPVGRAHLAAGWVHPAAAAQGPRCPCLPRLQSGLSLGAGQQKAVAANGTVGRYAIIYTGTTQQGTLGLDDVQVYAFGELASSPRLPAGQSDGPLPRCAVQLGPGRLGSPRCSAPRPAPNLRCLCPAPVPAPQRPTPLPTRR